MPDSLDLASPVGGGDEFIARCEIRPGADGCSYSITGGGVVITGGLSGGQPPTPEPGVVAHVLPATLNVVVREGIRVSSGDARRQGPNAPAHVRTREESGAPWLNIFGVTGSGDGTQASRILSGTPGTQLVAQNLGFRIPLSAALTGISVEIDRDVFGGTIDSETASLVLCGASAGVAAPGVLEGTQRISSDGVVVQTYPETQVVHHVDSDGFAYRAVRVFTNVVAIREPLGDPLSPGGWSVNYAYSPPAVIASALDRDDRFFVAIGRTDINGRMDVYHLAASDGSEIWATPVTIPSLSSEPAAEVTAHADGGVVVAVGRFTSAVVHVILDADTGSVLDTIVTDISLSNPVIATDVDADGNVYVVGETGGAAEVKRLWPTTLSLGAVDYSDSSSYSIKVDAASNSAFVWGSGVGLSRYLLDGGGQTWEKTPGEYDYLVVGRAGEVYAKNIFTTKIVRLDPTTGNELWAADPVGEYDALLVPYPPLASSTIEPLDSLFDEGYETTSGIYACTLSPLTPTGVGAHRLSASLDDVAGWLPADVNNISFGVVYAASGSGVVRVDAIRVYVDYAAQFSDALEGKRPNGLAGVAVAPSGRRVAVGVAGKALYSDDGVTWTEAVTPTVATLLDVTWDYKLGRFVAVGRGVVIAGDGATWARVDALIPETLWEVRSDRKTRALAAMGEGGVSASPDTLGNWLTRYT